MAAHVAAPPFLASLIGYLGKVRADLVNETATQVAIKRALLAAGFEVEHEKRLSKRDRIDFLVACPDFGRGAVGIEVKLKRGTSPVEVFKQVCRYAEHAEVQAIVLDTSIAMTLPPRINGKEARVVSLGRAWL